MAVISAHAPLATYRIQLNRGFTLSNAHDLLDYYRELGISHLYLSPCLAAAAGSMHGYDMVDPSQVNPEIGGQAAFERLSNALATRQMGMVLDIVPNHMAISDRRNRWWWDVLQKGRTSAYAHFFDIHWDHPDPVCRGKILLPILGDEIERCLDAREIQLQRRDGELVARYYEHETPLSAETITGILRAAAAQYPAVQALVDHLGRLKSPDGIEYRSLQGRELVNSRNPGQFLAMNSDAATAVDAVIGGINASPARLQRLLERQHYRLAFWRSANRHLNYRRFFDIHQLAGVCVEKNDVFAAMHELVLRWVHEGRVAGLRIDHPDGLRDPAGYLERLHEAAPDVWIVVEKILEPGETLVPEWPVSGTTGYDFLNVLGGLFIDPKGEKPLTETYRSLTGQPTDFHEVVRQKKIQILENLLVSEVSRLVDLLVEIRRGRFAPDVERNDLHGALVEVIGCFPVYRTYIRPESGTVGSRDRRVIADALSAAVRRRSAINNELLSFLEDILLLRLQGETESDFVLRFQQLTGPAMAKGLEDTTFYCYNRLVALNEVGGNPGKFGTSPQAFHAFCTRIQAQWPQTMTSTATHDTKRGEDTRLRIGLLSEVPEDWGRAVWRWFRMNAPFRRNGFPDASSEYFLYQTLVGTWPIDSGRLVPYLLKAAKESKTHTSWTDPDPVFEESLQAFVDGALGNDEFTADLTAFLEPLAQPAMMTSLAQTLIKCTAPGIPDVYQGTELWDLSLVDPDNRRAVDYDRRRRMLAELDRLSPEEILGRHAEGLPKLFVLQRCLLLRRRFPEVFGPQGGYDAVAAAGGRAQHFIGFLRAGRVLTLALRLAAGLAAGWGDTQIHLNPGSWTNVFTGERWSGGPCRLERLLGRFPVGLLVKEIND